MCGCDYDFILNLIFSFNAIMQGKYLFSLTTVYQSYLLKLPACLCLFVFTAYVRVCTANVRVWKADVRVWTADVRTCKANACQVQIHIMFIKDVVKGKEVVEH